MKRLRLWILAVALGCFAAGMSIGMAIPGAMRARGGDAAVDPDEHYVRRIAADFALDPAQERLLRAVVHRRAQDEWTAFRRAEFEQLPAQLQQELRAARSREEQRLRELLDRPDQRARYEAWTREPNGR